MNHDDKASPRIDPPTVAPWGVYLMFFASGAAALTYQVIWARWLGLIFGNTTLSISIVLGAFMLGLAAGSWLAGRRLHRLRDPMMAYVILEAGIGVYAMLFPLLLQGTDWLYVRIVAVETPASLSLGIRSVFAFLLLVVPTTCMGATLPLLTDFFRRHPRQTRSWKVGLLYAANTFGAAAGTLAASFFLIEMIGVLSTNQVAAMFNFLVAGMGYQISRALGGGQAPEPAGAGRASPSEVLVIGVLAASGATALASEVLWTRPLSTLVGNSTYAFATILFIYLTGIALGSWMMSLVVQRLKALPLWLAALQGAMGLWILVAIVLFEWLQHHLRARILDTVTLTQLLGLYAQCISILLPLAWFSGAMFPVATRLLDPGSDNAAGTPIARAYAWNTLGALGGSLLAGFVIAPHLDFFQALYLLAAIYALTTLAALAWSHWLALLRPLPRLASGAVCLMAMGVAVFGIVRANGESRFIARLRILHPELEVPYHVLGIQGVTTVLKRRSASSGELLLVNMRGMTGKTTDTKMMAHLPLLFHPSPDNTLVICFGMGTTYRSAVTHQGKVTVVELVQEVLDAFEHYYEDAPRIRHYSKGRMIQNDGRNFLKLTRESFDVITVDPPPPIDAAGVNNLYSREFIELAKTRLKEGGILAHWIPRQGTGGVYDAATFTMLVSTMYHAFPHVYVLNGIDGYGVHVLGSGRPIRANLERIKTRLNNETVSKDLREWKAVPLEFFLQLSKLTGGEIDEVEQVSDDTPHLEFNLLRRWHFNTIQPIPLVPW